MSRGQLAVYWLVAGLMMLLVVAPWSKRSGALRAEDKKVGDLVFDDFPGNEVALLEISNAHGKVTCVREGDTWRVLERDGYLARNRLIFSVLRRLSNLKVLQAIEAGEEHHARFGLVPELWEPYLEEMADRPEFGNKPLPMQVWLRNKRGELLEHLTVGGISSLGGAGAISGRFVWVKGAGDVVYVVDEEFRNMTTEAAFWLQNRFLSLAPPLRVEVRGPNEPGFKTWAFVRRNLQAMPSIEGLSVLDAPQPEVLVALDDLFSEVAFADVLKPEQASSIYQVQLERQATIDTSEGVRVELRFAPHADSLRVGRMPLYIAFFKFSLSPGEETEQARQRLSELQSIENHAYLLTHSTLAPINRSIQGVIERPKEINPPRS